MQELTQLIPTIIVSVLFIKFAKPIASFCDDLPITKSIVRDINNCWTYRLLGWIGIIASVAYLLVILSQNANK